MTTSGLPVATAARARRRLLRLLADRIRSVVILLAFTALATAGTLAGPALVGVVVDSVASGGPPAEITIAAAAYAAIGLLSAGASYLAGVRAGVIGEDALSELRQEVFDHALSISVDDLERAGSGELVSRITGDVATINRAVRSTAPAVFFATVELLLTAGALILVHPLLAAAALAAALPAGLGGGWWYARHAPVRYRAERQAHADLAAGLVQAYRGAGVIAAYRAHRLTRHQLAATGRRVIDSELAATSARNRLHPSESAAQGCALVTVLVAGSYLAGQGAVSIGAVSAAALYLVRVFHPIGTLMWEMDELQQAGASLARLVGITETTAHRSSRPGGGQSPGPTVEGGLAIALKQVTFGYRAGAPVLSAVDLDIGPGERVVIVGPSGAGKSTLAKLLCGVHRPWEGRIDLDGRPLEEMSPEELSEAVALVDQDAHAFARSIADNVALGRPGASGEDILRALQAVGALEWVERLPDGLATRLGPGGYEPSPAEAQQVGLARIVCAGRPVVVLDEATADLDPGAAEKAEGRLMRALTGRTQITVAHRLDVASRADRVIVMENGVVIQAGSHEQLLASQGPYSVLWERYEAARSV